MKLITFRKSGEWSLGIAIEHGILDVKAAVLRFGMEAPTTADDLIAAGHTGQVQLQRLRDEALSVLDETLFTAESDLVYGPCVTRPEKIVCVGTNYRKHALESNMPIPKTPVLFSKFNNALAGHNATVQIPTPATKVDYEVELVMVIGREARDVPVEDGLSYVFGYCTGNDLSARDLQFTTGQWLLGKTCDGFAPVGPYLVTADEIGNPNGLNLESRVNGQVRQSSNTRDMIFNCAELVSYISRHMTLQPGDLIFTGTPEGVILGYPEAEQQWLQSGDEVVVSVEGLGELKTALV